MFAHLMGSAKPSTVTPPAAPAAAPQAPASDQPAATAPAAQPSEAPPPSAAPAPAAPQASSEDATARARQEERARCSAIFADPAAGGRVAMAATLAFTTDLSAEQAIAVLKTAPAASSPAPAPAGNPFATAMGAIGNPNVGADKPGEGGDDPKALVAQILKAGA
nr:hypothetical protein [Azospirillum canadense]